MTSKNENHRSNQNEIPTRSITNDVAAGNSLASRTQVLCYRCQKQLTADEKAEVITNAVKDEQESKAEELAPVVDQDGDLKAREPTAPKGAADDVAAAKGQNAPAALPRQQSSSSKIQQTKAEDELSMPQQDHGNPEFDLLKTREESRTIKLQKAANNDLAQPRGSTNSEIPMTNAK